MKQKKYAEGTAVPVERSRAEIERLLTQHAAVQFYSGWERENAYIGFKMQNRFVKFVLPLPVATDKAFTHHSRIGHRRTTEAAQQAYEAEVRRRWRALLLAIKAKLEVVESGIATFDEEFLAHIVLPDQKTIADYIVHQLDRIYARGGGLQLAETSTVKGEP